MKCAGRIRRYSHLQNLPQTFYFYGIISHCELKLILDIKLCFLIFLRGASSESVVKLYRYSFVEAVTYPLIQGWKRCPNNRLIA